jgi:hypothetical protein
MATSTIPSKHDLGSLRIHEGQRKAGSLGKRLGLILGSALLLVILVAGGYNLRSHTPTVEVAVARSP